MASTKADKTAEAPAPAPKAEAVDPRRYKPATDKPDESTVAQIEV